jgi:hypothetical protein
VVSGEVVGDAVSVELAAKVNPAVASRATTTSTASRGARAKSPAVIGTFSAGRA